MAEVKDTSGYKKGKPDVPWWLEQIKKGIEDRDKWTYQSNWNRWRDYYRGNWRANVMPVNLFFMMIRTIVPRIYFRNPSISVSPAKPGFMNMAFARMLERADNKMIKQMRLKQQMKKIIQDTFMFGTGFGKLGFGGRFVPSQFGEDEVLNKDGERLEFVNHAMGDMPWFARVRTGNMVWPAKTEDFSTARWAAEKVIRALVDVKDDPRLKNTKDLQGTVWAKIEHSTHRTNHPIDVIEMWEIHDRKTGKVILIAVDNNNKSKGTELLFEDDALQQYGNLPYFPLVFNEDDETAWGVPDSKILEPQQLEINETRTQIMKHRRMSLIKILVKENAMTHEEAEKLVSEDIGAVVFIKGDPRSSVENFDAGGIPRELFASAEMTMQDTRETVGFSRNQFGEFNSRSGDTTATEANIVKQASEIRVDERRDLAADLLQEVGTHMHGLMFENWGTDQVVDVIGPGGVPIWVEFRGELLKNGRYNVTVDPDSAVPESRELRERRAVEAYSILKENPLIDPVNLTQFLLTELKGVEFDEMMKQLPAQPGVSPGQTVNPAQFADLLGSSLQQTANGGV